ncbi:Beclin-1 [Halotydeus destructor]|nr:Beclin-1 [Halotydeus destructor]
MSSLNLSSTSDSEAVTFACQRCCKPLNIQSSFEDLEDDAIQELTGGMLGEGKSRVNSESSKNTEHGHSRLGIVKDSMKDSEGESNGNGFLVIGDVRQQVQREEPHLKYRLQVTSRLFDILSDQSEVNHPLCEECADIVIDEMDSRLRQLEDEYKDYKSFLDQIEKSDSENEISFDLKTDQLQEEVKNLRLEEAELLSNLELLDKEYRNLQDATQSQRQELEKIQKEEKSYWQEYNSLKRSFYCCDDELQSVNNQLRYCQSQLDKLKRTNVFNATFHIWHSGHFGTINSFRLGRLPDEPVEWAEINAAWGQAVLLLHSLAKKIGLEFKRYRLVPYGNHSFLESLEDKSKELPLYGSGGFRFFWNTKFDQAMVAFLDCLQQFKEEVERGDSQFCLPYKMDKGKIEDTKTGNSFSIRIQFNSEEQWTKALKFMLTNLKWALAWVSSQFPRE